MHFIWINTPAFVIVMMSNAVCQMPYDAACVSVVIARTNQIKNKFYTQIYAGHNCFNVDKGWEWDFKNQRTFQQDLLDE